MQLNFDNAQPSSSRQSTTSLPRVTTSSTGTIRANLQTGVTVVMPEELIEPKIEIDPITEGSAGQSTILTAPKYPGRPRKDALNTTEVSIKQCTILNSSQ